MFKSEILTYIKFIRYLSRRYQPSPSPPSCTPCSSMNSTVSFPTSPPAIFQPAPHFTELVHCWLPVLFIVPSFHSLFFPTRVSCDRLLPHPPAISFNHLPTLFLVRTYPFLASCFVPSSYFLLLANCQFR